MPQIQRLEIGVTRGPGIEFFAQAVHRPQAPSERRPDQQPGNNHECRFHQEQRNQHDQRQAPALTESLRNLDDDRVGHLRKVAGGCADAHTLSPETGIPEYRLLRGGVRQADNRKIRVACQHPAALPDAVVDVVAFGVLKHTESRWRNVERDVAPLGRQRLGNLLHRGAQQLVV